MKSTISYFPLGIKLFTPFIFGLALYLGANHYYVWSVVLIVLCLIVLTTNYVTKIDLQQRKYSDYVSMAGIKLSDETGSFQKIDRIFITKGNYTQKINTRVQSRQMDWSDYTATILFDEDNTLDLITRNDKHDLLIELKKMLASLEVDVEDRTGRENYFVDMSRVS